MLCQHLLVILEVSFTWKWRDQGNGEEEEKEEEEEEEEDMAVKEEDEKVVEEEEEEKEAHEGKLEGKSPEKFIGLTRGWTIVDLLAQTYKSVGEKF